MGFEPWSFRSKSLNVKIFVTTVNSKTLQRDLQKLEVWWEKAWEMDFNSSKCQILHISRSRVPVKHPYMYILHDQVLQEVDHAKYLGLDISRDLSWITHIQKFDR